MRHIAIIVAVAAVTGCSYTAPDLVTPLVATGTWFDDVRAKVDVTGEVTAQTSFLGVLWRAGCGGCVAKNIDTDTRIEDEEIPAATSVSLTPISFDGSLANFSPVLDSVLPPPDLQAGRVASGVLVIARESSANAVLARSLGLNGNAAMPLPVLLEREAAQLNVVSMLPIYVAWLGPNTKIADFHLDLVNLEEIGGFLVPGAAYFEEAAGAHFALQSPAALDALIDYKLRCTPSCADPQERSPLTTGASRATFPMAFEPKGSEDILSMLEGVDEDVLVAPQVAAP